MSQFDKTAKAYGAFAEACVDPSDSLYARPAIQEACRLIGSNAVTTAATHKAALRALRDLIDVYLSECDSLRTLGTPEPH